MGIIHKLILATFLGVFAARGDGWLGISLADTEQPTVATVVPGSPAASVGMLPGDVVLAVGDAKTDSLESFVELFAELNAGEEISLRLRRGDEELKIDVRLASRPVTNRGQRDRVIAPESPPGRGAFLGVAVSERSTGLHIARVLEESPAARAGLHPGDRILRLSDVEVRSLAQIDGALSGLRPGAQVEIAISREGKTLEIVVTLGSRPGPAPVGETAPETQDALAFSDDYEASVKRARREGRPVILVFGASWSVDCRTQRQSFTDETLSRALRQYERIWIDTDRQSKLADRFDVETLPHIEFYTPTGDKREILTGYQPPEVLLQHLESGLRAAPVRRAPDTGRSEPVGERGIEEAIAAVAQLRQELDELRRGQLEQRALLQRILEELRKK